MISDKLKLYMGEVLLGTLNYKTLDTPWFSYDFSPTEAFAEVKPLFDREAKYVNEGDFDEDTWEELMKPIDALKLRLIEADSGNAIEDFLVHIQNNEASFRY